MELICFKNPDIMEIGEKKVTFASELREKRVAKGWSQYHLASRAGCTNSNISYLENHPNQRPKIETVEALADALGWPVNEARRMAGYLESDVNISAVEVEDDFRFALYGYKQLSDRGRGLVKKQIRLIVDFVLELEQEMGDADLSVTLERQLTENMPDGMVPKMTLGELGRRIGDSEKQKRRKS